MKVKDNGVDSDLPRVRVPGYLRQLEYLVRENLPLLSLSFHACSQSWVSLDVRRSILEQITPLSRLPATVMFSSRLSVMHSLVSFYCQ